MIRNRNMIFGNITDASPSEDKYIRVPKVLANTNAPTAANAINGSLYYDDENDVLYCCKAGAWKAVTVAS